MKPLFAASRARAERAKTFIAELAAELDKYAATGVHTKVNIGAQGLPAMELIWDEVPLLVGMILGDAVHSLRTALDLMATDLAIIAKQNPDEAYFPFATDLDKLRKSEKFKTFSKSGSDCAELLEKLAPYHGGNKALRALHDLDIQDKHKATIAPDKDLEFSWDGELDLDDPENHTIVGNVTVTEWKFPPNGPLAGEPIIPSLEALANDVEGVLEAFAALVAARKQSADAVRD